jgi:hypothetical protein
MKVINPRPNLSVVQDTVGHLYALDNAANPNFLTDAPDKEYEVYPISKDNEIEFDNPFILSKNQLKPTGAISLE